MTKKLNISSLALIPVFLLGLTLTSCHHDDDDIPQSMSPIRVGGARQANMDQLSRAGQQNLEDLLPADNKTFRVWCFKTMGQDGSRYTNAQTVMDSYIVKWTQNTAGNTTTNTSDWEYAGLANDFYGAGFTQDIKYWDNNATSYRFFGFTPKEALIKGTNYQYPVRDTEDNDWLEFTFTADAEHPENAPYISKLWFADQYTTQNAYKDPVVMEFLKPVTKVQIKLYKEDGTEITNPAGEGITFMSFSQNGQKIVQQGTLKVSYAITGPATTAYYTPKVEVEGGAGSVTIPLKTLEPTAEYSNYVNVLPHVTQEAFQLEVRIGGETMISTVPSAYMSWHPNVAYTYRFKFTENNFKFIDIIQIGVTEWRTESSSHPVYNW